MPVHVVRHRDLPPDSPAHGRPHTQHLPPTDRSERRREPGNPLRGADSSWVRSRLHARGSTDLIRLDQAVTPAASRRRDDWKGGGECDPTSASLVNCPSPSSQFSHKTYGSMKMIIPSFIYVPFLAIMEDLCVENNTPAPRHSVKWNIPEAGV